ncbi:MAG: SH3 domain-containing protein [Caldilineales bacterium]|nr:SH3 domain-containing protein [Caldilineales bacterium]
MAHTLQVGDLAVVIAGQGGPNNVRRSPKIGARIKGKIPEHAVLAILPKPAGWQGAYPHSAGGFLWWYVRGRTETKTADGRFKVIEGWSAASENSTAFLRRMPPSVGCLDTMGTTLDTNLQSGQQAYVLPKDGLNVRRNSAPNATRVGGLRTGSIVEITGGPECDSKMVWWQVKSLHPAAQSGWVSGGNILEWFLAPLTLM